MRNIALASITIFCIAAAQATPATAAAPAPDNVAIVVTDQAVLRAAPRDGAQQQAQLWAGEVLEVRGERLDYLQVWNHQRERGGFVKASQVRRSALTPSQAPELLSVIRFLRDGAGTEALGIGYVAAYLRAANAESLRGAEGVEAFDALGTMADRLAHRVSFGAGLSKPQQAALAAQLDVVAQYGVGFKSYEREGRMQVCYDGEMFRRVLAMQSQPAQQARAALGLTRPECVAPDLQPLERAQVDQWRADTLARVDASALPGYLKNRVLMRRAGVWSALAYARARQGLPAQAAAEKSLVDYAGVIKGELPDVDQAAYAETAMRVNASRWAAVPDSADAPLSGRPAIATAPGAPGETCVMLIDAKHDAAQPLAKRCTYSLVWPQSANLNREGTALALAVQPMQAWRELWVFRKQAKGWSIDVLPPGTSAPDVGYAEFAGWLPGGRQMLVAREASSGAKTSRGFEVVSIASLAAERKSSDATQLGAFQRWQDTAWKRMSPSLR